MQGVILPGQERVEIVASELKAGQALEALAEAKRRRGSRGLSGGRSECPFL